MRRTRAATALAAAAWLAASAEPARAEEARYLVRFRPGRVESGRAAVRAAGGRVALRLDAHRALAARLSARALARLRRSPDVEYVEPDPVRRPLALWSDRPVGGETLPYGVQMVQADLVSSADAANRTVCIIDSGYAQAHADLKDALTGEVTFDADEGSGEWDHDSCGHGTHVAGTVAAVAGNGLGVVGVDPGVRLHIVKIFGDDDLPGRSCAWTWSSRLVDALDRCVQAGAQVVNLSLGGDAPSRIERLAFRQAYRAGVLAVAAAGNQGGHLRQFPAGYPSVVSVGAVWPDESVAAFSQRNTDVELTAPGGGVLSAVPWLSQHTLAADGEVWSGAPVEGAPPTSGVTGPLVDGGACLAAPVPGAWAGKMVLCARAGSSVAEKVAVAGAGGAAAAAISNDTASEPSCGLFRPSLAGAAPTLPAIALTCADGEEARSHARAAARLVSQVTYPASGYEARSGTSSAAPHVAAVAALVWSCHPSRTAAEIRAALVATARDLGTPGRDVAYGFGLVQARAALLSLGPLPEGCSVR
jgi:subtilisin family serine protease